MSILASPYPDQIWQAFRWTWRLPRSQDYWELLAVVDATITRQFTHEGYAPQSSDEYLDLIRAHYSEAPDVTHSFVGLAGTFATCFKCEREGRGLHFHALPRDKTEASRLLSGVESSVGNTALRYAELGRVISELTWGHKLTIISVILTALASVATLTTSFPLVGILLESVRLGFWAVLVLSLLYLVVIIVFVIARAYYGSRLVWRF